MMIKTNNGYLDFDDIIEVERQVKLFEEIATTDGDFSYQFQAEKTSPNLKMLGFPFPDNKTKLVYHKIDAQLVSDDGLQVYDGFLRIEGITTVIYLSFFSGNNNWFGLLSGPISDVDFSDLDIDQTQSNIQSAIFNTEGVIFPLLDNGALISRGFNHLKVEDFVAGIYVKTVFKRIFQHHSIKIQGDLLNDVTYNSIFTLRNGKSQEELDASTVYALKTSTLARPGENVHYKLLFDNDSVYPAYDGTDDAFDITTSVFTAKARMRIDIEVTALPAIIDASYNNRIYIYINGVYTFVDVGLDAGGLYNSATPGDADTSKLVRSFILESGDTLEVYSEWQQSTGATANNIVSGSIKITPTFLYKAYGNSIVPNWTQQQFVSNILRGFNILSHYNSFTKTLTFDLFDKLKSKEQLDLSDYISIIDVDYIDFISNYGKRNLLSYQEVEFDEIRDYNIQNFFRYAQGVIEADNDFLEPSVDIIESDFSNPQSYINPVFDMSMERVNFITFEEKEGTEVTTVTDSSGVARFRVDQDLFLVDDIVRISDSTNLLYNGDWVVSLRVPETTPGAKDGYVQFFGLQYDTDATARMTLLRYKINESDDVYLLWNIPLYAVVNFSGKTSMKLENTDLETMAVAYFSLLNTGRQINTDFNQSLSFGEIADPLFYQRTMVETYWSMFEGIVNDPVKLFSTANLPYNVFINIDFLRPITIKTLETSNMYYLNRITGYEASEKQCTLELIKLASVERENTPAELVTPEILQAIQVGIANGSVVDLNFTNPLTPGSKVMFFMANVANGVINMTLQENTGNPNMGGVFESYGDVLLPVGETDPANAIGQHAIYVLDVIDPDDTFQFEWVVSDGNTHYSCGFAIEIAAGAEWDQAGMNQDLGYSNTLSHPVFLNGTSITSVPDVVMSQNQNLFIPIGISMGLSPGGNAFDAPFGGLNPSGGVNPAGVLMGFAWNGVALPEAGDYGGLVFQTTSGISGERQWLNWGNFYIP